MLASINRAKAPAFRADIQGMRALAVLMVLLFHFRIGNASGGFAGVDVFFVISGFLMTSILAKQDTTLNKSALKTFYVRRVWRIVPAYLTTVLLTLILGGFYMLPLDYQRLGDSTSGALAFISNIVFASEANYFSDDAINKPLLHTWSLGVEMQFYLIWPLAFLVVRRFTFAIQALILTITAAASFAAALYFASLDPELAFYNLPTRLWEFAAGALLANPWVREKIPMQYIRSPMSNVVQTGALICLIAFVWFGDEQLSWPAPYAIIPVVATMILLGVNLGSFDKDEQGIVTRILSVPAITWLGEISYSLYLIHWPIACFIFFHWWPDPSLMVRSVALVICIPLALILYHGIERPLRTGPSGSYWSSPKPYVVCAILVIACASSAVIRLNNGLPGRYDTHHHALLAEEFTLGSVPDKEVICASSDVRCKPVPEAARSIYLWGDSHAAQLVKSVSTLASVKGRKFKSTLGGACPPLKNASRSDGSWLFDNKCLRTNQRTFEKLTQNHNIHTVILSARWAYYADGVRFGNEPGNSTYLARSSKDETSVANSRAILEEELKSTVEALILANKHVVIVLQVPELASNGKRCFIMQRLNQRSLDQCSVSRDSVDARQASYRSIMRDIGTKWPTVSFIDPIEIFCAGSSCSNSIAGNLAYSDNNHILAGVAWKLIWKERHKILATSK